jgi:hypothetical protein
LKKGRRIVGREGGGRRRRRRRKRRREGVSTRARSGMSERKVSSGMVK